MKTRIVKLVHEQDMEIDATIDVFTGKPLVTIYQLGDLRDDISLRPIEADRLADALIAAARAAREKIQRR